MSDLETYLAEHGAGIAFGLIAGIGLIILLVVIVAAGGRRPPDGKDDP